MTVRIASVGQPTPKLCPVGRLMAPRVHTTIRLGHMAYCLGARHRREILRRCAAYENTRATFGI